MHHEEPNRMLCTPDFLQDDARLLEQQGLLYISTMNPGQLQQHSEAGLPATVCRGPLLPGQPSILGQCGV